MNPSQKARLVWLEEKKQQLALDYLRYKNLAKSLRNELAEIEDEIKTLKSKR